MAGQSKSPASFDWDDSKFARSLVRKVRNIEGTTKEDVLGAAIKITNAAKQFGPRRTGYMVNNIVYEEGNDAKGYFVVIYCRAFYWKFVEFGTRFMTAQPFMRPAFLEGLHWMRNRVNARRARQAKG